jgi:GH24 family phage-related lysozyme (muramidase)
MNWYKQQKIAELRKESWDWDKTQKGFWAGAALGLAAWLGVSQLEVDNLRGQLNDDNQAVAQALAEEVIQQGGNPQEIIQEVPTEIVPDEPSQGDVAQLAPTREDDTPEESLSEPAPPTEASTETQNKDTSLEQDLASALVDLEGAVTNDEGEHVSYIDSVGVRTVGYGHAMGPGQHVARSQRMFDKVFKPEENVSWQDVYSKRQALSQDQADRLLDADMKQKINVADSFFDDFQAFPRYLQVSLAKSVFRGEMEKGHKTVALINAGRWKDAAKEYLNRGDYRNAVNGIPDPDTGQVSRGIISRMEAIRDDMLQYANELSQ